MSILNLILYFLIASSFIGLVFIIYSKIPLLARLSNDEITILNRKKGIVQRISEIDYKGYWLNFLIALEKFLRKIKIVFLKIENLLSKCIDFLRNRSQIMTQKSREWIKQREGKRRESKKNILEETKEPIFVKINKTDEEKEIIKDEIVEDDDDDDLSISELKKPIKEEQKWIDLIIEDPKNITAYKFLGLLYWKQHNYADAKASLEMSIKLGSKDKRVKDALNEMKDIGIK